MALVVGKGEEIGSGIHAAQVVPVRAGGALCSPSVKL